MSRDKILKLLGESNEGISTKEILQTLNITSATFYSQIHELKKAGYNVVNDSNKYFLRDSPTMSDDNKPSVTDRILNTIQSHDGITSNEICAETGLTISSIYSGIMKLRRNGFKIKSINNKYYFKQSNKSTALVKSNGSTVSVPTYVKSKIHLLDDSDRNDYLNAMKKSFFYKLSADAIIKANELVEELSHSM
jgi:biotin operon repressor